VAIESQGTALAIETGTGAAITISAIALGAKTKITGTHALAVGDVVTFADIVGTVQLNGYSYMVTGIQTTVSFWIDVDSTAYTAWSSAGTATPVVSTDIGEVVSISGPSGTASEFDVTHLQSTAKEFMIGLMDEGEVSFDVNIDHTDAGQLAFQASRLARTSKTYTITWSDAKVSTFTGYAKSFSKTASVDDKVAASLSIRISGPVVTA